MTDISQLLGANIKSYRLSCNMTQAKLAALKKQKSGEPSWSARFQVPFFRTYCPLQPC